MKSFVSHASSNPIANSSLPRAWWNVRLTPFNDAGLRTRKKAALRQYISDTATQLFLTRGFDAVHIKDIAKACDVSEKTVYNYFPVKEALLLDREEVMIQALRNAFANHEIPPTQAMANLLHEEIEHMTNGINNYKSPREGIATVRQFLNLVETHPGLSMYQHTMMDRLVDITAELLSQRNDASVNTPETRIAAEMLIGLWNLQHRALGKFIADATERYG
jgi:AcrR family transcriptional regulator